MRGSQGQLIDFLSKEASFTHNCFMISAFSISAFVA